MAKEGEVAGTGAVNTVGERGYPARLVGMARRMRAVWETLVWGVANWGLSKARVVGMGTKALDSETERGWWGWHGRRK